MSSGQDDDARFHRALPEITKMAMIALALTGMGIALDVGGSPPRTAALTAVITVSVSRYALRFGSIMSGVAPEQLPGRRYVPTVVIGLAVVFAAIAFAVDYAVVAR